ncbi:MAG TPA: formylglycine-generating enzyme family protein, partial [Candidatus Tectomicrobia bacterium]
MHQHQACPRWFFTGVLLLVGFLITAGTLAAQTTPEKTLTNSMGMEFVLIPSGTFKMGSDTGDADERPVHQVTISKAFYMGKYEVTQGQWQAIMANNPSASPGDANRPVDQVAWNDVQTFLSKLNAMEGGQ